MEPGLESATGSATSSRTPAGSSRSGSSFPSRIRTSHRPRAPARFDLRSLSEALPDYAFPYDTPPHDRTFYEHQLQALSRYYQVVSNGRLSIEYTVLPRQTSGAYRLPKEALLYGNGRSTAEIGEKWIDFIRDAVAAADEDAVFSDFDSFLFIHPGQGQESGEINDIRSVYLPRRDLDMYGGPTPIGADGGAFELPHAWIVPEMADRFGRAGLNGLLAKFFGFVLGLPSLTLGWSCRTPHGEPLRSAPGV